MDAAEVARISGDIWRASRWDWGGGVRVLRSLPCVALGLALGLALAAAPAYAHAHLTKSAPPADATLTTTPTAIHLWFSEPLELSLTRITLYGPAGTVVPLGPVVGDSASRLDVTTAVSGVLAPGRYAVEWHVMAADGHPSHGTYTFAVAGALPPGGTSASPTSAATRSAAGGQKAPAGARVQRLPVAAPGPVPSDRGRQVPSSTFDVGSPLYVIVRWVLYLGMMGLIGAVVFFWFVLGRLPIGLELVFAQPARVRAATLGAAAATLVVAASVGRLVAQSAVMQTAMGEPASPAAALTRGASVLMVLGTEWGRVWWLQIASAAVALGALVVARTGARQTTPGVSGSSERIPHIRWLVATLATVALALTPALSGHAAAVASRTGPAIIADTMHVLGAGGWLGTLLAVLIVGIPSAIPLPRSLRGPAVAALVNTFSPVALVAAGVLALTGTYTAVVHLGAISALWATPYGRVLLIKLAVITPVALTGFYNWRVVRPRLGADSGIVRVRRSAAAELSIGALVIAVTAVLVATPTPEQTHDGRSMSPVGTKPARPIG